MHSWYVGTNPGRFGPESIRPIFRVGRFGLGRWVVLAHFRGESFWPWVVSAKVYRNYYGMTGTDRRILGLVTVFCHVFSISAS